jgi:hypothetical protein
MSYIHDQKLEGNSDDLFGEVISSYTDQDALEDGTLIAYHGPGGINRLTHDVYAQFTYEMGPGVTDVTALHQAMESMLTLEPEIEYIATVEVDHRRKGTYRGKTLWLLPNEVGGLTLMFPEDY